MPGFNIVTRDGTVYRTVASSRSAAIKRAGVPVSDVLYLVWASNRLGRPAGLYSIAKLSDEQLKEALIEFA